MDPLDQAMSELGSGDLNKPAPETSTSKDEDPLDQALLEMMPVLPDF